LEARELHSSVRRLLVVAREQHNEVSRVLNGLMHLLDEIRSNRNVVVLDEDLVALLGEDVGDLLRNGGHRAPTAHEEVLSLAATSCPAMVTRRLWAVKNADRFSPTLRIAAPVSRRGGRGATCYPQWGDHSHQFRTIQGSPRTVPWHAALAGS